MRVEYTPNWSHGEFPYGHFEFRSPHSPSRGIPVSETGYLSHFAPMADIEAAGSVEGFARRIVEAIMAKSRKGKRFRNDSDQLSLF
jgi:hypothetical protein